MKVVIIGGAGGVGSTAAFHLLCTHRRYEIVLADARPGMTLSHIMDLENVPALSGSRSVVRPGTAEEALDADIVVLSAAVPLRLNTDRAVFLAENARIVGECLAPLRDSGFRGVVLLLTNPVNHLLTWVHRHGFVPRERLIGYTFNDTLRFRTGIARVLGVPPPAVDAWVLGEHGDGQVPVFSRVTVDGSPVRLTALQRTDVLEYTDTWYAKHVALDSGRTSTWSSGLGTARLVEAVASGADALVPAAVVLEGEYGVAGVGLGVPVLLGPDGVREVARWELDPKEAEGMRRAAAGVRKGLHAIDSR